MPSMPLYFWGDHDGSRYRDAYFDTYPGVWRHGDWLRIDSDGTCTISGRSDATINRNGLRMGTSEIYAAMERLPEVDDSMLIELEQGEGETALVLFVVLQSGLALDEPTRTKIAAAIRVSLSPRFLPDLMVEAPSIPRTLSGKKQELPVKRLFMGWPVDKVLNREAMANPQVVGWYEAQAARWRMSVG
jgi:acetoacetyl-CoA synthetase